MSSKLHPIAVDLDGTLIRTDTLHESCLQLIMANPLYFFLLPFWLFHGKAYLKQKIAEKTSLDVELLPYRLKLIAWLKSKKNKGHLLVLCTAADRKVADKIASHFGIFNDVISSNGSVNMVGQNKKRALVEYFGEKGFIYVANSSTDLKVWGSAAGAVICGNDNLVKKTGSITKINKVFSSQPVSFKTWLAVFRIHQYLKNLLLFVPVITAHQIDQIASFNLLLWGFASFSFCASSVYITNDLMDLDSDRRHPRKRNRPFASGLVPIKYGILLSILSLTISLGAASQVGTHFITWLVVYFLISLAYSLRLKRYIIIDCLTLATLYTLRIIAGGAAVGINLSFWLLAFSTFQFLSLAFVKRYAELKIQILHGKTNAHGRGYHVEDAPIIQTMGISAGFAAILVLTLYLNTETVISHYPTPQINWLVVPLMIFWLSWMWMKTHRGEMNDDPVLFAIRDKASLTTGLLLAITFILASNWGRY